MISALSVVRIASPLVFGNWNKIFHQETRKIEAMPIVVVPSCSRTIRLPSKKKKKRTIRLLYLLSFLHLVASLPIGHKFFLTGENSTLACVGANNTASTEFTRNLKRVFNQNLYQAAERSLYYNTTEGESPDTVYGLYRCNFGISPQSCQNCIVAAGDAVMQKCNGTKMALAWYNECMVRYSNTAFPVLDQSVEACRSSKRNVT